MEKKFIETDIRGLVEVLKETAKKHESSFSLSADGDDIVIAGKVNGGMESIHRANSVPMKKPGKVHSGVVGVFYSNRKWLASGTCKGKEKLWKYCDNPSDAVVARLEWEQRVGVSKEHDFEKFREYVKMVERKEDAR
jgi:hypothetical protein